MKFYKTMLCALVLSGVVACSDDSFDGGQTTGVGYLSFEMATPDSVENVTRAEVNIGTVAGEGYSAPADGDFNIVIKEWDSKNNESGEEKYNGPLSGWSNTTPLMAGSYVVKATYSTAASGTESNKVGFNKPVFESEEVDFTVVAETTTTVNVPVSLKNAIVRLEFTDMFNAYYSYEKFTITSAGTTIDLTKGDTRGVFVDAAAFTIAATLTSQAQTPETDESGAETGELTNKKVSFSKEYTAKAGNCYTIKFDASNVGGIGGITITFGDQPSEEIDMGDIDLNSGSNNQGGDENQNS